VSHSTSDSKRPAIEDPPLPSITPKGAAGGDFQFFEGAMSLNSVSPRRILNAVVEQPTERAAATVAEGAKLSEAISTSWMPRFVQRREKLCAQGEPPLKSPPRQRSRSLPRSF